MSSNMCQCNTASYMEQCYVEYMDVSTRTKNQGLYFSLIKEISSDTAYL